MPPKRRNSKRNSYDHESLDEVEPRDDMVGQALFNLTKLMENLNTNLSSLMEKVDNTLISRNGNVSPENVQNVVNNNANNNVSIESVQSSSNNNVQGGSRGVTPPLPTNTNDRSYISAWKDLGGNSIYFSPGGAVHPIAYIKKLERAFEDAAVPESKRVNLAKNCLKSSAQDWAQMKEASFTSFDVFKEMFLARYWGITQERELFQKLKFGAYQGGSKADYFLKIVAEAKYLTMQLSEAEVVKMAIRHFPSEVKRGIVNAGFTKAEEVEEHLREIDDLTNSISNCNASSNNNNNANNNRIDINRNWRGGNRGGVNSERPIRRGDSGRENEEINRQNTDERATVSIIVDEATTGPGYSSQVREETGQLPLAVDDGAAVSIMLDNYDALLEEDDHEVKQLAVVPIISVLVENNPVTALVDSGSQLTCVSDKFYNKLISVNPNIPKLPANCVTVVGALGDKSQKVREQVYLKFNINDFSFDYACVIVPKLIRDVIFGCDWLQDISANINFENKQISGYFQGRRELINFVVGPNPFTSIIISELGIDEGEEMRICKAKDGAKQFYSENEIRESASRAESFDDVHKQKLFDLLINYKQLFSDRPGRTHVYEHEIWLHDYTPFYIKSYPVPKVYRDEVKRQLNEMIEWGVIKQASTEYVSPLVVVTKKDKSVRICMDARYLNSRMVKDHVTPPNPSELIHEFTSNQVLSVMDLTASYWQIPIREEHQKYAGFSFEGKTYVFRVLPFGFATSVGSFIVGLSKILGPEVDSFVIPYVDDIVVHSPNSDIHLEHLRTIFEKFNKANITIKLKKSRFACKSINFLGHIITPEGIQMDPARVEAIQAIPPPRTVKQLRSFLGLVNYDRRFCDRFSELTVPLTRLLKKGQPWKWGSEEAAAFQKIKEAFLEVTILRHPNPDLRYYVQADASGYGIAACLFQKESENRNVIAYFSRTLQAPETRYSTTEREALAIVAALRQWRVFVIGRPLTIVSDHKALSFIRNCRLLNARLTRWILFLQEFDFQIEYIKGSDNVLADTLSRFPCKLEEMGEETPEKGVVTVNAISECLKNVRKKIRGIKELQNSDDFCIKIKSELNKDTGLASYKKWYVVYEGQVFRRGSDDNPGFKLILPKCLISEVVMQEHNDNGHFGSKKCWSWLRRHFYFKKMRQTIRKLISGCEICQKAKISPRTVAEMHSVLVDAPNKLACLDLMGPLPPSRGGVTQLLVIVDAFSKYVALFPLKRATAKAILRVLVDKYFVEVGKPAAILSDNGTQFKSKLWEATMRDLNITVRHTSVYYPQGNMTERVNREIGRLIRTFCYARHTKWGHFVKDIARYLNEAIHESTGYSPIEIHFGKRRVNPFLKEIKLPEEHPPLDQDKIILLARENLRHKAFQRQLRHNSKHLSETIEPGCRVLVRCHRLSSAEDREIKKFFLLYEGPYVVKAKVGHNSYEVIEESSGTSLGIHHITNIKKFVSPIGE